MAIAAVHWLTASKGTAKLISMQSQYDKDIATGLTFPLAKWPSQHYVSPLTSNAMPNRSLTCGARWPCPPAATLLAADECQCLHQGRSWHSGHQVLADLLTRSAPVSCSISCRRGSAAGSPHTCNSRAGTPSRARVKACPRCLSASICTCIAAPHRVNRLCACT